MCYCCCFSLALGEIIQAYYWISLVAVDGAVFHVRRVIHRFRIPMFVCILQRTSFSLYFVRVNGTHAREPDATILLMPFYDIKVYPEELCYACLTEKIA